MANMEQRRQAADWTDTTPWEVEDHGRAGGVRVRRLAEFPCREPEKGEAADTVILEALSGAGVRAVFSENHLWTTYWVFLYWDTIFSAGAPRQGDDIPRELFGDSFYESYRDPFRRRRSNLSNADLCTELANGRESARTCFTRLLDHPYQVPRSEEDFALASLPAESVLRILDRLWVDYNGHRSGLPDILLLTDRPTLVEIKGPKDRISDRQIAWLRYISSVCDLGCEILVIGWSPRRIANLKEKVESSPVPQPVALVTSPSDRLKSALEDRPYPAAYKSAAVALRAMIRAKRKSKADYAEELLQLYELAAESGFALDTPFIKGIGPGFNVAESIPRETLDGLSYRYEELGYEELSLCNKTDKKWFIEAWGEPQMHSKPQDLHAAVWAEAVRGAHLAAKVRQDQWDRELQELVARSSPARGPVRSFIEEAGRVMNTIWRWSVISMLVLICFFLLLSWLG